MHGQRRSDDRTKAQCCQSHASPSGVKSLCPVWGSPGQEAVPHPGTGPGVWQQHGLRPRPPSASTAYAEEFLAIRT